MLRHVPAPSAPDLLVGTSSGDDAAVWRVSDDRALVATVDFFTPVVDDARTWGMIAAANSASDVYAMAARSLPSTSPGGRVTFCRSTCSEKHWLELRKSPDAEVGSWWADIPWMLPSHSSARP